MNGRRRGQRRGKRDENDQNRLGREEMGVRGRECVSNGVKNGWEMRGAWEKGTYRKPAAKSRNAVDNGLWAGGDECEHRGVFAGSECVLGGIGEVRGIIEDREMQSVGC